MNNEKIPLVKDTINLEDISKLVKWLETNPRLTKGEQTIKFEEKWSEINGNKYSTFVNSGSSANLLAYYALILSGRLKNKKVVVPALSWVTTVSPAIQLGLEPIMCDCNFENLGLDIQHLKKIIKEHDPALIVTVNVLGFANNYEEIIKICNENNCLLLEDSCESIGTVYNNKKTGNFGDISTFSFYYGHHMSTIEGGMVCTNDEHLNDIIVSIRSHGWDRDLNKQKQDYLRNKYNIDNFKSMYTFYYPGFNFRSTDLQAYLGILQLERLEQIVEKRKDNFSLFNKLVKNIWINPTDHQIISNFAFPYYSKNIKKIILEIEKNNIETRPLICGSMAKQPFWIERYGHVDLPNAELINNFAIYLPNNPLMKEEDVVRIVNVLNEYDNDK